MGNRKNKGSALGTALKAAVVGVAAGAAAVALADEKKRKKLEVGLNKAVKEGTEKMEELSGKAGDFTSEASKVVAKKVEELEKKVAKTLEEVKKSTK